MDQIQELRVEQVMTPAPVCLEQDCTLAGALAFLVREHYQAAPVVDRAGALLGVVTRANLFAWLNGFLEGGARDVTLGEVMGLGIGPAIDTDPLRCSAGMRLKDASKVLVRDHAPAMLVLRDGRLVGILTLRDVVRAMAFGDERVDAGHVGHGRGGCFSPSGLPENPRGGAEDEALAGWLERREPRRG
ncbi:MAG: CBS domain-containing protein [Planctomycetes bacterium]|nr:CBS domain-containing protein [Planctomycetota bacterium]